MTQCDNSRKYSKNKSKKLSKVNRSRKSRSQRGGTSNACVSNYATSPSTYQLANAHNLNPQALGDLDGKFMQYGGPVPLGQMGGRKLVKKHKGGFSNCGDSGVGTNSPKSNTFKQYLDVLSTSLDVKSGGGACNNKINNKSHSKLRSKHNQQKGSGYTVDPTEFIAGQPVYKSYDDNSPPAIIGGQLQFGAPDQPICGAGAIKGGGRKHRLSKKSKSKLNKKTKQRGGDFTTLHSKPADYTTAYDGPKGVFNYPEDMSKRSFGDFQPNYSVDSI